MWMIGQAIGQAGLRIRSDHFREVPAAPLDASREPGRVISPSRARAITLTRKGTFKLLPTYLRPMLNPAGIARRRTSSTARDRLELSSLGYNAPNLRQYLQAGEPVEDVAIG